MEIARLSSPKKKRRLRLFSDDRVCAVGDNNIEADKCLLVKTVAGEEILMAVAVHPGSEGKIIQTADGRLFAEKDVLGCVGVVISPVPEVSADTGVGQAAPSEVE